MGPPSYMRFVVERNAVLRRMPVLSCVYPTRTVISYCLSLLFVQGVHIMKLRTWCHRQAGLTYFSTNVWLTQRHIAHLSQRCHNSKCVIFQERLLQVLKCCNFSISATTTQLLSSGEFFKLRYDTIHVKSAFSNVSFCTNNSKMPNFES